LVTPFYVLVLDVVVDQREIVDQFKGRCGRKGLGVIVGQSVAGEEAKGGPERFPLSERSVQHIALLVQPTKMIAKQSVSLGVLGPRHNPIELLLYRAFVLGEHSRKLGS
jgi:hypothetical protein